MVRITVGVGVGFDRHHKPISVEEREECKVVIIKLLTQLFGGVTIIDTLGGWREDKNSPIITEPGMSIIVYAPDASRATYAAEVVRDTLNQTAVYLSLEADFQTRLV